MSPERQKEIASKGGRAAHAKGTAHEWTPDEARTAGRKGGQVSRGGRGRLPEQEAPATTDTPLQQKPATAGTAGRTLYNRALTVARPARTRRRW